MNSAAPTTVGLRIDVDTLRGTRYGVPRLLELLANHRISASFFFSVGPDNMGRHVWRLLKPRFLIKMLRSNAVSLYGWDILLRGIFWPGPEIGRRCAAIIRAAADGGHEIGLHAWDHHAWQSQSERWTVAQQRSQTELGLARLGEIVGKPIDCSAAAGWRADQKTIDAKEALALRYHSDCRGDRLFRARLSSGAAGTAQVPVTLPTYDEIVGRTVERPRYNEFILSCMKPERLNVYTVHAEVEGIALAAEFDRLLTAAAARGIHFTPLGKLLPANLAELPLDVLTPGPLPGREGWVGWQSSALARADRSESRVAIH